MSNDKKDKELDLVDHVRSELNKCKGEWTRLSKLTKRKLSYRWLVSFADGEIKDPGARKLILLGSYIGVKIVGVEGGHFCKFTPE